jgi:hypothetical protein
VVVGKTAARHTSQEFVAFLADLVVKQPRGKEIHLIRVLALFAALPGSRCAAGVRRRRPRESGTWHLEPMEIAISTRAYPYGATGEKPRLDEP